MASPNNKRARKNGLCDGELFSDPAIAAEHMQLSAFKSGSTNGVKFCDVSTNSGHLRIKLPGDVTVRWAAEKGKVTFALDRDEHAKYIAGFKDIDHKVLEHALKHNLFGLDNPKALASKQYSPVKTPAKWQPTIAVKLNAGDVFAYEATPNPQAEGTYKIVESPGMNIEAALTQGTRARAIVQIKSVWKTSSQFGYSCSLEKVVVFPPQKVVQDVM